MKKLFFCCLLGLLFSCDQPIQPEEEEEEEKNVPILNTAEVTEIKEFSAISGGNVIDDRGLTVTARGVCWSTHQTPSIEDDTTFNGTGAGPFTSFLTELEPATDYYIRAYAINEDGVGYGSALFFTTYPYDTVGTFTDVEGNVYPTVRIGDQWWLAENLRQTHWEDGSSIDSWYCYDHGKYGVLYRGKFVELKKNVYPAGWRTPSDDDWKKLELFIGLPEEELDSDDWRRGSDVRLLLRVFDPDYPDWTRVTENCPIINPFGFSALPAGKAERWHEDDEIELFGTGDYTCFWTSSEKDRWAIEKELCYRAITKNGLTRHYRTVGRGFYHSIRLVKDVSYD
jgi:uncharacterized protein (TIGR02145 family)